MREIKSYVRPLCRMYPNPKSFMETITYTTITQELAQPVVDLLRICFPQMRPRDQYSSQEMADMADIFPEGTIVALDGEKVVGMGTGIFVDLDLDNLPPTEDDLLYTDGLSRHTPTGAYYFGSDLAVHPDYRGRQIGRNIYIRRKAVVTKYHKKGFVAAAVLPGYEHLQTQMSAHDYVNKVVAGELFDPTLSMQMRNGFQVLDVLHHFIVYPRSDHWCALIFWPNPECL